MFLFPSNDQKIIAHILSEDSRKKDKAIELLYHDFFPATLRFVQQNNGTRADAQDLFQETIVILYRNLQKDRFQGNSSLKTYFLSIARNAWMNHLRKTKNILIVGHDLIKGETPDHETGDENSFEHRKQLIDEAMNSLKEKCRDILVSFYYENNSMSEIAAKFAFNDPLTAKNQKYRCLTYLIKLLKQRGVKNFHPNISSI